MSFHWIPSSVYGGLPAGALLAGNDADGSPIYVGRTHHEGDQLPVKVVPSRQSAYVSWGGQEINVHDYEVLVGQGLQWVGSASGHCPDGAVAAGSLASGEPVYIGRAHFQGSLTPGKVHCSHGCLYIPFGGQEHRIDAYEVLVAQPKARWVRVQGGSSAVPFRAVLAGRDVDGSPLYVGRAEHEGTWIPAKVTADRAYVAHSGREHTKYEYDVLCDGQHSWVSSGNGAPAPYNAVAEGNDCGEPLYIGRGWHQGQQMPGKVHLSHGCLYIPFGGQEVSVREYEILVEH